LENLKTAGVPEWPLGFQGRDADRVDGAQLRDLVSDKTWKGKHKNGTEFIQYFDTAGNTAYRSANTSVTGVIEVRDDSLCEKFDGYFLDKMACGYVYRNTTNDERDADYIHVTPHALAFFSVAP
jgi:adenylate cyclase